ncbi:MAG: GNAT family N-acetyltransferase [Microthrixaceae bacterium]|nr:GNAT family N-acetyltransferase [Microthrixaceae bacterium]HMT23999.1 GNAT family N-acetyltransferase [Microthrixaceae bacterium]HMT60029.1 GNAT family N-acetyltransferase [Microthrixaceae bacterium]
MTAEEIEIRPATAIDRAQVVELCQLALGWRPDQPNERFFAWKHDENAFGTSPIWVATDSDGRFLGVRTFMRWRFIDPSGAKLDMVRAVDTATHPDAQGRGIFTKLTLGALPSLRESGIAAVFNTPNDKSRPGYLKMGWSAVGRVAVTAAFRTPGAAIRVARSRTGADKWSIPTDLGTSPDDAFADTDGVARLLARRPRTRIATDWSAEALRWRYGFPELRYRVVPCGDSIDQGAIVFRLRRRGEAVEAAICDVFVGSAGRGAARRALRLIGMASGADYRLMAGALDLRSPGFVPFPGSGPILTWKPLARQGVPVAADLGLRLGDVELF